MRGKKGSVLTLRLRPNPYDFEANTANGNRDKKGEPPPLTAHVGHQDGSIEELLPDRAEDSNREVSMKVPARRFKLCQIPLHSAIELLFRCLR